MTREAFYTWLYASDFISIPLELTRPATKGLMEVELPAWVKK